MIRKNKHDILQKYHRINYGTDITFEEGNYVETIVIKRNKRVIIIQTMNL